MDDFLNPLDALLNRKPKQPAPLPEPEDAKPSGENTIPSNAKAWGQLFAASGDDYFFGKEPSVQARAALLHWEQIYPGRRGPLLDLGCGEGRDAVFFAEQGFDVVAVDGAAVALDKTSRLAQAHHVGMTRILCDVREYTPSESFAFVHLNNCLQFLGEDCLPYLERVQQQAPTGALHSVSVMTREYVPEQEGLYRFDCNELKFRYQEWKILQYAETMVWREPAQRYLSFASILALRP